MERQIVKSSNIRSMGWAPLADGGGAQLGTMEVEFTNGSIYEYANVPYSIFDGVRSAPSVGGAFRVAIVRASAPYLCTKLKAPAVLPVTGQTSIVEQLEAALDAQEPKP